MEAQHESTPALIKSLYRLTDENDRGGLAALRRGLGEPPGTTVAMYPYVTRFVPGDAGLYQEQTYYLTAALFGLYPEPWTRPEKRNFGWSMAELLGRAGDRSAPIEDRFVSLLDAEWEDLPTHLRGSVSLMKSKGGIGIDWTTLLRDLAWWSHRDGYVQRRWARSFWAAPADAPVPESEPKQKETE